MKILHVGARNKFTVPYFRFLGKNFDIVDHCFLCRGGNVPWPEYLRENLCERNLLGWIIGFAKKGVEAEKIFLHGLSDPRIVIALFLQPWLLRKCYWVLAGGDLYVYALGQKDLKWRVKEFFRRSVIKNLGHIVCYIEGDTQLAREWYGARGKNHKCLAYPSNTVDDLPLSVKDKPKDRIIIQVGNSADPSNEHIDSLTRLIESRDENIEVYVPLSYGGLDHEGYVDKVIAFGRKHFGDQFFPLIQFMPLEEYGSFLNKIDIGIFNHRRQQALGNIRMLLALGKKVYIRPDITSWQTLIEDGFSIYDINKLELSRISEEVRENNVKLAKLRFSEDRLIVQWRRIFNGREVLEPGVNKRG